MHLPLVDLALMTRADNKNEILEDRRPKITSTKDLLSSSIPRYMTTIGARMVVIQNSFGFVKC